MARRAVRQATSYRGRLALVVLAGAALRLALLAHQPLWRDEAFTAVVVRKPLADMIAAVSRDSAPPLSYLLEHVVARLSTEPWALRLVPAIAGLAMIPIAAALGRRIGGERAGVVAGLVVAVLPSTVATSRDARMYALAATLALAATFLLWRALERPVARRWVAYLVVGAAAAWTDYFALLALAAALVAAAALRPRRRTLAMAMGCTAVAALSLTPWVLAAPEQLSHAQVPFWVEPLGVKTVGGTLVQLASGPPIDPGIPFQLPLQGLQVVAIACGAASLGYLVRGWPAAGVEGRKVAAYCAVAGTVGVAALAAASAVRPLLDARYAAVLWPSLFALAGAGLALAPRGIAAWLVAGLAVPSVALGVAVTHPETDRLLPAIEARLRPQDLVDAYPSQYLLLLDEGSDALRARLHVVSGDVPWFWGTAAYPAGAVLPAVPAEVVAQHGRVLRVAEPEDPPPLLPAGYREVEQVCEVRVCLTVYAPTA